MASEEAAKVAVVGSRKKTVQQTGTWMVPTRP